MNKKIISIAVIMALPFTANATQTIVTTNTPAAVGANGTVKKASASAPYVTNEPTAEDKTHIASTAYVKGAYNDAIAAVNKVDDSTKSALDNKQAKLVNETSNHNISTNVTGTSSEIIQALKQIQPNNSEILEAFLPDISEALGINYDDTLISTAAAIDLMGLALDNVPDLGLTETISADDLMQKTLNYTLNDDNNAIANTYYQAVTAEGVMVTLDEYNKHLQYNVFPDKQNQLTTTVNNASQNISSTVAQTVNTTTPSATTLVSETAIANAISNASTAQTTALNNKRVEAYTTWGSNTTAEIAFINATPAQSGQ